MSVQRERVLRQVAMRVSLATFDTESPSQPLPNARRFVCERFDHLERPLLVHQGGLFYVWDGTCWPALDDADLRSQLYKHFEHAMFIDEKVSADPSHRIATRWPTCSTRSEPSRTFPS